MKLVDMTCPHCGAALKVDVNSNFVACEYCGTTIYLDDEAKHVKFDDAEKFGYDFEKGRQRAKREFNFNSQRTEGFRNDSRKRTGCLQVFLWIYFFPIMLTVFLWRTPRITDDKVRIGAIAGFWIVLVILALVSSREEASKSSTPDESSMAVIMIEAQNDVFNELESNSWEILFEDVG